LYASDSESRAFNLPQHPFSSHSEQCSTNVPDILMCRPENFDNGRSRFPVGSWLDGADMRQQVDVIDEYCAAYDTEYGDKSVTAFTATSAPETGVFQRSGYHQPVSWTSGYQTLVASSPTCSIAHADDVGTSDQLAISQLSAVNQLQEDSCSSNDVWLSGVTTAKKMKQVRPSRLEHIRCTTQAASRRASTGSLLCAATLDTVSNERFIYCILSNAVINKLG